MRLSSLSEVHTRSHRKLGSLPASSLLHGPCQAQPPPTACQRSPRSLAWEVLSCPACRLVCCCLRPAPWQVWQAELLPVPTRLGPCLCMQADHFVPSPTCHFVGAAMNLRSAAGRMPGKPSDKSAGNQADQTSPAESTQPCSACLSSTCCGREHRWEPQCCLHSLKQPACSPADQQTITCSGAGCRQWPEARTGTACRLSMTPTSRQTQPTPASWATVRQPSSKCWSCLHASAAPRHKCIYIPSNHSLRLGSVQALSPTGYCWRSRRRR